MRLSRAPHHRCSYQWQKWGRATSPLRPFHKPCYSRAVWASVQYLRPPPIVSLTPDKIGMHDIKLYSQISRLRFTVIFMAVERRSPGKYVSYSIFGFHLISRNVFFWVEVPLIHKGNGIILKEVFVVLGQCGFPWLIFLDFQEMEGRYELECIWRWGEITHGAQIMPIAF